MPRPGSHKYDIQRAHERKRLEDEGIANDQGANEEANRELQGEPDHEPVRRTERGRGPEGDREPGV
ncbi:hypothetical protein HDA32_001371 [Spinactinospora alkalitolerans]|uniref:Phosphatidylethanolamine-binding protein n=1 Tax=Spinactinospora alkalitolerans TaxID=687207 RepID=A0A852TRR0_9ACTN|nr:hypothetical protein [Spinactinospora alkalitolerans]NYE46251.1 hypothetical protein [Spinactinospora alkalitolerans]